MQSGEVDLCHDASPTPTENTTQAVRQLSVGNNVDNVTLPRALSALNDNLNQNSFSSSTTQPPSPRLFEAQIVASLEPTGSENGVGDVGNDMEQISSGSAQASVAQSQPVLFSPLVANCPQAVLMTSTAPYYMPSSLSFSYPCQCDLIQQPVETCNENCMIIPNIEPRHHPLRPVPHNFYNNSTSSKIEHISTDVHKGILEKGGSQLFSQSCTDVVAPSLSNVPDNAGETKNIHESNIQSSTTPTTNPISICTPSQQESSLVEHVHRGDVANVDVSRKDVSLKKINAERQSTHTMHNKPVMVSTSSFYDNNPDIISPKFHCTPDQKVTTDKPNVAKEKVKIVKKQAKGLGPKCSRPDTKNTKPRPTGIKKAKTAQTKKKIVRKNASSALRAVIQTKECSAGNREVVPDCADGYQSQIDKGTIVPTGNGLFRESEMKTDTQTAQKEIKNSTERPNHYDSVKSSKCLVERNAKGINLSTIHSQIQSSCQQRREIPKAVPQNMVLQPNPSIDDTALIKIDAKHQGDNTANTPSAPICVPPMCNDDANTGSSLPITSSKGKADVAKKMNEKAVKCTTTETQENGSVKLLANALGTPKNFQITTKRANAKAYSAKKKAKTAQPKGRGVRKPAKSVSQGIALNGENSTGNHEVQSCCAVGVQHVTCESAKGNTRFEPATEMQMAKQTAEEGNEHVAENQEHCALQVNLKSLVQMNEQETIPSKQHPNLIQTSVQQEYHNTERVYRNDVVCPNGSKTYTLLQGNSGDQGHVPLEYVFNSISSSPQFKSRLNCVESDKSGKNAATEKMAQKQDHGTEASKILKNDGIHLIHSQSCSKQAILNLTGIKKPWIAKSNGHGKMKNVTLNGPSDIPTEEGQARRHNILPNSAFSTQGNNSSQKDGILKQPMQYGSNESSIGKEKIITDMEKEKCGLQIKLKSSLATTSSHTERTKHVEKGGTLTQSEAAQMLMCERKQVSEPYSTLDKNGNRSKCSQSIPKQGVLKPTGFKKKARAAKPQPTRRGVIKSTEPLLSAGTHHGAVSKGDCEITLGNPGDIQSQFCKTATKDSNTKLLMKNGTNKQAASKETNYKFKTAPGEFIYDSEPTMENKEQKTIRLGSVQNNAVASNQTLSKQSTIKAKQRQKERMGIIGLRKVPANTTCAGDSTEKNSASSTFQRLDTSLTLTERKCVEEQKKTSENKGMNENCGCSLMDSVGADTCKDTTSDFDENAGNSRNNILKHTAKKGDYVTSLRSEKSCRRKICQRMERERDALLRNCVMNLVDKRAQQDDKQYGTLVCGPSKLPRVLLGLRAVTVVKAATASNERDVNEIGRKMMDWSDEWYTSCIHEGMEMIRRQMKNEKEPHTKCTDLLASIFKDVGIWLLDNASNASKSLTKVDQVLNGLIEDLERIGMDIVRGQIDERWCEVYCQDFLQPLYKWLEKHCEHSTENLDRVVDNLASKAQESARATLHNTCGFKMVQVARTHVITMALTFLRSITMQRNCSGKMLTKDGGADPLTTRFSFICDANTFGKARCRRTALVSRDADFDLV